MEPLDGRIAVALEGDKLALSNAVTCFHDTKRLQIKALPISSGERTSLLSDELNSLTDEREIRRAAERLIELVNGLLFLSDTCGKPLHATGTVYRQASNGNWGVSISLPAVHARAPVLRRANVDGLSTREDTVLATAKHNPNLVEVLRYLSTDPDWIDLFRAFEVMEQEAKWRLDTKYKTLMDWPSGKHIDAFTNEAQFHRHSTYKHPTQRLAPSMTLNEARKFVRDLSVKWINSFGLGS